MSSITSSGTISRLDVKPDEVATHFDISVRHARRFFERGWILAEGDFNLCVCLGARTWRGDRTQWNKIRDRQQKN